MKVAPRQVTPLCATFSDIPNNVLGEHLLKYCEIEAIRALKASCRRYQNYITNPQLMSMRVVALLSEKTFSDSTQEQLVYFCRQFDAAAIRDFTTRCVELPEIRRSGGLYRIGEALLKRQPMQDVDWEALAKGRQSALGSGEHGLNIYRLGCYLSMEGLNGHKSQILSLLIQELSSAVHNEEHRASIMGMLLAELFKTPLNEDSVTVIKSLLEALDHFENASYVSQVFQNLTGPLADKPDPQKQTAWKSVIEKLEGIANEKLRFQLFSCAECALHPLRDHELHQPVWRWMKQLAASFQDEDYHQKVLNLLPN